MLLTRCASCSRDLNGKIDEGKKKHQSFTAWRFFINTTGGSGNKRYATSNGMIITVLIIRPAISAASNTAIMAMMNTAIIMGMAIMSVINAAIKVGRANSTIIIGTAIMAASNASIVAAIIIRLLDDATRFDVERMDHAGKR